ncbi:hypothetical protein [Chitinophaga caseinilytica]|uniref:O-antigen ligase-like membrane protein n=1 Tax=Chitinophaga caseinilytica TaxID=2267521 RepID=A0ABZ2Z8J4_9BACT
MKKSTIYSIICSILFFIELTGVKLSFMPIGLSKLLLLGLTAAFFIDLARTSKNFTIPKHIFALILVWIGLGVYAAMVTVLNGVNDFAFLNKIVYLIYEPVWTGFIISYFITRYWNITLIDLLIAIANALTLHALLAVAAYLLPPVNALFNALLPNLGNLDVEMGLRVKGFTNLGGAWLSSIICLGVIIHLYRMSGIQSWRGILLGLLKILVCVAGTFVTGRTGLMLSLLALATYPLIWIFQPGGKKTFYRFYGIILLGAILIYRFTPNIDDFVSQDTLNWALEIFMQGDGEMSTSSTQDLQSMLYLPDDKTDLIFGIGFYETAVAGYERSDSGYLKTIFSTGLLGAIVFYGSYLFLMGHTLWMVKQRYGMPELILITYLYGIFFIVEVKEPYLQTIGIPNIIFLIYFTLFFNKKFDVQISH